MHIPWTDRQVPATDEIFLDHVGWMLPDIDIAAKAFERMGFPLTPLAIHKDRHPETGEPVLVGSANRLAVLPLGYLEFLTPVKGVDTVVSQHMRGAIARHVGVHLIAFTVPDAERYAETLVERGFELHPTVHLRRLVDGETGAEVEAAFTVIRAKLGSIPEGRLQALTHLTPEHVWQDRLLPKENGLLGLAETVFAVENPEESAARFERFTGKTPIDADGETVIPLDRGRLRFLTPDAARALVGGPVPAAPSAVSVGLVSADLEKTRAFLKGAGVPVTDGKDRLAIAPDEACGVHLMIYPQTACGSPAL